MYIYGYGANSTLVGVVPSPLDRVAVAEFLNRDRTEVMGGVTFR